MYWKLSDKHLMNNAFKDLDLIDYCAAFTELTRDGVVLINETGQIIFWNAAMETILGVSKSDALNSFLWDIHHRLLEPAQAASYNLDRLQQVILRTLETGQATWMENIIDYELTLPDGAKRFLQLQCFPLPVKQQFMIGGILRDVTKEREAVIQLKQEQNLLQSIIKNVHEVIFTFNLKGEFTFVSPGWIENRGYEIDEVMGNKFSDFVHPDDIESCWEAIHDVIVSGQPHNDIEFRILRKDGDYAWYLSSASLVCNELNEPSFLIGIATDISERKKMEAALRESEARLRLIQDNMTDMVLLTDLNGIFIYASPSYERVLGHSYRTGKDSAFDNIHPDDRERAQSAIRKALTIDEPAAVEHRHLFADGSYIWLESVGSVVRDENGNPTGFQVTSRDITARRLYQEKLEYLSVHDVLTGLYNRTYFEAEFQRLESGRFDPLSIIMLDSDGLKLVNDNLGHQTGDRLLQTVADILKRSFRDSDIIARMGGDEFVILCPCCGDDDVSILIERLQNNIDTYNQEYGKVPVCLSYGYAVRNDASIPISEVLRQADRLMYEHKAANRSESQRLLTAAGLY